MLIPMIGIAAVAAPWGPVHVAANQAAIVGLSVLTTRDGFAAGLRGRFFEPVAEGGQAMPRPVARRLTAAVDAIVAHLAGDPRPLLSVAFDLGSASPWDRLVLDGVRRVRWGEVASYGSLARTIGRPGAARAVGGAVARNPIGLIIPCHRIIAADGTLGGYGGGWFGDREALLAIKRELLSLEGIEIPPNRSA